MSAAGQPPDDSYDPIGGSAPTAPPVVAVMVTHDPGPWLEEALASLAAQDYPNLSTLVIDAASGDDPTARIAAVLPSAYVRRLPDNRGFGASANDVLDVVEGASHFVFLHDDVALDPAAVRLLVEEAYRSNAGIVSPKLVAWDDPRRLAAVGGTADKSGHVVVYGRGELDQEQHDAVRDVFLAPGGCQLVRADLFASLGGFDPELVMFGEDLDLSWRAQVAGARVVVAPGARARHLEATVGGHRPLELGDLPAGGSGSTRRSLAGRVSALRLRHRLRAMLTAYGPLHLVWVLPQAVVFLFVEALIGRGEGMSRMIGAWRWNLARVGSTRERRRRLRALRLLPDREVRRLQTRADTRVTAVIRSGLAVEERTIGVGAASRQMAGAVTRGGIRLTIAVWLSLAFVLAVGSRFLLSRPIPLIGQIVPFPEDTVATLELFLAGWHPAGLGSAASPPFGLALIGALGTLLLGAEQLAQKALVLGMLPLGIIGMHRLTAPLGSWRARLLAAVLYAAVPLPYDALSRGRWAALIAYGAMPWIVSRLLRASGVAPFGAPAVVAARRRARRRSGPVTAADAVEALLGAEAGTLDQVDAEELRVATIAVAGRPEHDHDEVLEPAEPPRAVRHPGTFAEQAVPAAVVLALAAAFAPPIALATLLAGAGLVAGFVLVGSWRIGLRCLALAGAATGGAALLLVPWTLELISPGSTWTGIAGLGIPRADAPGLGELLTFHVGSRPLGPLSIGLFVAAVLPLAVGRDWRFMWAARLWMLAIVCWIVGLVAARGWLGVDPPAVEVLLAPAAVAIVVAAALGLSAFEIDLPDYHFGWRQVASIAAAAAGVLATVPLAASAVDGRWRMPSSDYASLLSWMPERVVEGDFRVLWLGDPAVLPLDPWRLSEGLAYGSSRNGVPDARSLWSGPDTGSTGLLADAVAVARRGETTRVGALLAPLGVRYVAVPRAAAPLGRSQVEADPPLGLLDALRSQVDLRIIRTDDALVLFENAAWRPIRGVGTQPVLEPGSPIVSSRGPVPAGSVYLAESYSDRWQLRVGGRAVPHSKAEGWANGFEVAQPGAGSLRYRTPPIRFLLLIVEVAIWIAAIRLCLLALRRRGEALAGDANGAEAT